MIAKALAGEPIPPLPPLAQRCDTEVRQIETAGASGDVRDHLRSLFESATDPFTWPAFVFAAVVRPDSATLMLTLDHTNIDLYSAVVAAGEILDDLGVSRVRLMTNNPDKARALIAEFQDATTSPQARGMLEEALALAEADDCYRALRLARRVMQHEAEVLGLPLPEPERAESRAAREAGAAPAA